MNLLWSTGITVRYGYAGQGKYGWVAECKWDGGEPCKPGYMEGTINTRYYESTITEAIDFVLKCIKSFGIKLCNEVAEMKETMEFALYRDEENEELSEEILQQIITEAERRGWKSYIEL